MKQWEILKVLAQDLGQAGLVEINQLLKAKDYKPVKYRLAGKALGHFGFTGVIKAVTEEGVKVFEARRTRLIKFSDIESFARAKPRVERPSRPPSALKTPVGAAKKSAAMKKNHRVDEDEEFDDDDFDDDEEGDIFVLENPREQDKKTQKKKAPRKPSPTGSKFIPGK